VSLKNNNIVALSRGFMARKGRALVVDDMSIYRNLLKTYLSLIGYEVIIGQDGLDGYRQFEQNPDFKIIFSDIEMPNMDGYQLLSKIREHTAGKTVPVVMLTTLDTAESIKKAEVLKASYYMVKPFNNQKIQELMQKINLES
jgi:chemotaxis family two-component system sensor histidine kinase/response regulator PixL